MGKRILKKSCILYESFLYKIFNLKALYYSVLFKKCGIKLKFFGTPNIKNSQNIEIGNNVTINDGAYINGLGGISIGNNVSISALSIIVSTSLDVEYFSIKEKKHINEKIIIGNNVQIGAGSIILPGIIIGNNIIIGAGSIVTKNIEDNTIVVGNPAKILRRLNK